MNHHEYPHKKDRVRPTLRETRGTNVWIQLGNVTFFGYYMLVYVNTKDVNTI